jgi:hypothetical protein
MKSNKSTISFRKTKDKNLYDDDDDEDDVKYNNTNSIQINKNRSSFELLESGIGIRSFYYFISN